jgi:hypothetical protein
VTEHEKKAEESDENYIHSIAMLPRSHPRRQHVRHTEKRNVSMLFALGKTPVDCTHRSAQRYQFVIDHRSCHCRIAATLLTQLLCHPFTFGFFLCSLKLFFSAPIRKMDGAIRRRVQSRTEMEASSMTPRFEFVLRKRFSQFSLKSPSGSERFLRNFFEDAP